MSNCKITIQIINYEFFNKNLENTLDIPFDKFLCIFKYELNNIGQINLNSLSEEIITHSLKNVTRDLKYNVRIINSNDNDLIGVFDIILPFSFIKNINPSTTLELTKKYSLTMLDSTKRKLFGSIINATDIFFTIHASIDIISKMKNNRSFIIRDYKKNHLISLNNNNINTSYNTNSFKEKNNISSKNTLKHTISFTNKTLNINNNKRINTLPNNENILSPNEKKSFRTKLLIDNDDIFLSNKFNYIKTPPTEKKNKNFIYEKTNNINSSFNNTSTNTSKYNSSYKKNNYKNFMNNTLNYSHRESINKSKLNKKLNINKKDKNNNSRFIKSARSSLCDNNKKKLLNSNSFYQKPLKYNFDNYLTNYNNNNKNNKNVNISNFIYKKAKSRQIPQINESNNKEIQNFSTIEDRQNFSNPNLESILNNQLSLSNNSNENSNNSDNNSSLNDDEENKKKIPEEFIDPTDTSTIQSELLDSINNNNDNNDNKIDNEIYLIKNTFLSNNIKFDEENDSKNNGLHKNIQEIKDKILYNLKLLIKYQDLIKNKILSVQNKNNILKRILFKNQDKYQLTCKKYRELITMEQKNDDKNFIVVKKNTINDITKKLINSKKIETDIFKAFFDLTELQNYFNKYYLDDKSKLKLLINCIKTFIDNYGNISQAYEEDEDSRIRLKAVLFRYNINEKEIKEENEDENLNDNNNINNNKMIINNEISNIKAIKEVDEDKEEDDDEDEEINNSEIIEKNKIEKLIQDFQSKNTNIKLSKINDYEYKFGNQKFKIKLENDEIFVQFGNEYLKIEKYFEKIVNNSDNNTNNNSFLSSNKRHSVKGKISNNNYNNINGGNYLGKNSKNNSKKITSNNSFRKTNSDKK